MPAWFPLRSLQAFGHLRLVFQTGVWNCNFQSAPFCKKLPPSLGMRSGFQSWKWKLVSWSCVASPQPEPPSQPPAAKQAVEGGDVMGPANNASTLGAIKMWQHTCNADMDLNSTAKEMAPFNVYPLHPVTPCFASSAKSTARTAGTAGPDAGEREAKCVIKGFDSRTRPWQYIYIYIII